MTFSTYKHTPAYMQEKYNGQKFVTEPVLLQNKFITRDFSLYFNVKHSLIISNVFVDGTLDLSGITISNAWYDSNGVEFSPYISMRNVYASGKIILSDSICDYYDGDEYGVYDNINPNFRNMTKKIAIKTIKDFNNV